MKRIGRNDPCPCGSGKKFKKCHMGREDDLFPNDTGEITMEMSQRITGLPEVRYGRSAEIVSGLDIWELTGSGVGIRFIDLNAYIDLNLLGSAHRGAAEGKGGGVFINLLKTQKSDPDNIYFAISSDIDESTLIHELAHVLDYLGGSGVMPGTMDGLGFELGIPEDHLEHPEEFGYWLDYLSKRFDVILDADDAIIAFLFQHKMLIDGKAIREESRLILKSRSDHIFRFLSERAKEIDALIRSLPGYIGERKASDQ